MNDIRDLLPGRMRERTFQLKARRGHRCGVAWPQFVECKQCGRRATRQIWAKSLFVCPNCGNHQPIGAYYRLSLVLDSGSFRSWTQSWPRRTCWVSGLSRKAQRPDPEDGPQRGRCRGMGRIGGVSVVALCWTAASLWAA